MEFVMDRPKTPEWMEDYCLAGLPLLERNRVRSGLNNDRLREAGRVQYVWVDSLLTSVSDFYAVSAE